MLLVHRTALRRCGPIPIKSCLPIVIRAYHSTPPSHQKIKDPRLTDLGTLIEDDFAAIREQYQAPKHPIILAHGLLGFDELHPAGNLLPGVQYWRGITEALEAKGIEVMTASVPPSGSIEVRSERLAERIERMAGGKSVNIIAGLDARHMISRVNPPNVKVLSLTTIATPHRGSAFADYIFSLIGTSNIPKLYKALDFFGIETGAFGQLTESYMRDSFNPRTPDVSGVRYYSYGAAFQPQFTSVFRRSHRIVQQEEGPNDGLVSVASSRWGTYKGTLNHVSHLDLINWTNRLRWYFFELTGHKRNFNAIAFYLNIADMLAKEGL
ncbi:lipase 2 [Vermiconidia calcicola]|uniref:Lipase 2 n=1 Tax=Vermiconidia calcicola TaxID=1690605 RepID=A0ACC3NUI2_9PEZI|nr:lipase 2 [Vermiconidia calcicola]